ncbi:LacI family transcriptional regulator [Paenarthrobacter nicotinovorans]|uniref:LacI family transcriptional regulator n=1 Tax=Paenarthrobacter nicotinovorans TaxID=29320 RepID=A0ABT9TM26_PAENI|nr:LacI family DNA-binding transcriptional regulator [Paenarthrobacter nicotinovorans]MDQ0102715.1 LacI family transcriptional regulator [Paenarthrobacter nicotinovorans]GAT87135.1 LacI family transcription regulator [Paenarthrobacter nicotinovorans]
MSKGLKPTIRDVATAAGVSLTTVSYVLSGRHGGTTRISQPTQDRVLSAVKELGYVPNQAARGMRRGKTDVVAVAIGNLEWPWDRALATAAANILPERGYQPVILLGEDWRKFMMSGGADGVIIGYFPEAKTEDETVTELARRGVAQVVISETMYPAGFDVLAPETDAGLADCMEFLTASHRRIACIRRSDSIDRPKSRFAAYASGLEKAGIPLDQSLVRTSHHRPAEAYQAALELLQLPVRPTAILCTDDMEALQAIRAAFRLGLRVPEDVQIVGVGNSTEGQEFDPALTTVGPDPIFEKVVRMLLDRLEGTAPADGVRVASPWKLHRRGTTRDAATVDGSKTAAQ